MIKRSIFIAIISMMIWAIVLPVSSSAVDNVTFLLSPATNSQQQPANQEFNIALNINTGTNNISEIHVQLTVANTSILKIVRFTPSSNFSNVVQNTLSSSGDNVLVDLSNLDSTKVNRGAAVNIGTLTLSGLQNGSSAVNFSSALAGDGTTSIVGTNNIGGNYTIGGTVTSTGVSFSLQPPTASQPPNQDFDVALNLNTASNNISLVHVKLAVANSSILKIVRFTPSSNFSNAVQNNLSTAGDNVLLDLSNLNTAISNTGSSVNVGTLTLRGTTIGSSAVNFDNNDPPLVGTANNSISTSNNVGGTYTIGGSVTPAATQRVRIAETRADLENGGHFTEIPYTLALLDPPYATYTLLDKNPGEKRIWVKFIGIDTNGQPVERVEGPFLINVLGPGPNVASCNPTLNLANGTVNFDVKGSNFGSSKGKGKVKAGDSELAVVNWGDGAISGTLNQQASNGQSFAVTVTGDNGEVSDPATCTIGVSQIQLGTKLFCRASNQRGATNVEAVLADGVAGGATSKQTVTIAADGTVAGLKGVQEGKPYRLSVKPPGSLRRTVEFCAAAGTTEAGPLNLPVGDIAPEGGDGAINSGDYAELLRQWAAAQTVGGRSGDLNADGRVNSFDWACMRPDFNHQEDSKPTASASNACASLSATPTPAVSATPSPAAATPSPTPAGAAATPTPTPAPITGSTVPACPVSGNDCSLSLTNNQNVTSGPLTTSLIATFSDPSYFAAFWLLNSNFGNWQLSSSQNSSSSASWNTATYYNTGPATLECRVQTTSSGGNTICAKRINIIIQ